jgi:hypothetical protein
MSDANLIKGEQYVRANRGAGSVYDVGSAFGQGVATADAQIQLVRDQEKIARREIANKTEQWGSQLDGNIDASAVPDVYRQGITDFLLNQRNVYWEHAKAASNSEIGSEAYQAAVAGMNGVNSAVKNLRVQLDSYNTGSTAFAEASDSNHISGGMPLDELAVSEQIYSHTLPMHINDTGDIAFSNEDGNVMDLKDMPTLKLKDFKANNAYLGLAGKIYQSGNKLNGSLATLHRGSVRNILRGNRDTLLHMATDDSIIDGGFGIVDPHSLSTEELTTRMEDAMMDALGQVANDGYNAKRGGRSQSNQSSGGPGDIKMSAVPAMQAYDIAMRDHATGAVPEAFQGKKHDGKVIVQASYDSATGDIMLKYKDETAGKLNPRRPRQWAKFVIANLGGEYSASAVREIKAWEEAKIAGPGGYGSVPSTEGSLSSFNK